MTVLTFIAGADDLIDYFDEYYVTGRREAVDDGNGRMVIRVIRPPLFPPVTWNVYDQTRLGGERTNNQCEGWNSR